MYLRKSLWTVARQSAVLNKPGQPSCLVPPVATRIAAVHHESSDSALPKGEALWVNSKGELPPGAVVGGAEVIEGKPIVYVGRAAFKKALIPGKVIPWLECMYVGYDNVEYPIFDFQVLVTGRWVKTSGLNIPPSAVPAGYRAGPSGTRVPLYIGRVKYGNTITIGKVHDKNAKDGGGCWFPYDGKQLNCNDYEIFCA